MARFTGCRNQLILNMEEKLQQLKERLATIRDLSSAIAVLDWDQQTHMPPGGVQARADQVSTLQRLAHEYQAGEELGRLLDDLRPYGEQLDHDSDEAALIRAARREYEQATRVPADLVAEMAKTTALAAQTWAKARQENDFASFEPLLSKVFELQIRWAECFAPYNNVYDPLIDLYEPGMTYEKINAVFSGLKPELVALVATLSANQDAVDDSPIHQHWAQESQLAFCREVVTALGYDFERGRLDLSPHPFQTQFSPDDVRITTRVDENHLVSATTSVIHEAGHAIYQQGVAPALYRTGLDAWASVSIDESQSRFYENVIGRSREFWRCFYPRLQQAVGKGLSKVDMETFYRALNRSQPSLIRTGADEVTYGLHVILRFELENDVVNGRVRVADLPKEWNARMEAYLGITPPNDADGVLQDVHWSFGYVGYFPTYLLGTVFSVQLWQQMLADHPDIPAQIESGEFETVLGWLREKIHRHGRKFTMPELAERAVGGPLDWQPYIAYLRAKYGEIYGL